MMTYVDEVPEDNDTSDDGEVIKTLKDFKSKGQEIISELESVDEILYSLQNKLDVEEPIDKNELLVLIKDIRSRIGNIRKEEEAELGEDKIAINLLNKLRKWVEEMA